MTANLRTPQRSFAGGEQSNKLDARADIDRFGIGLDALQNGVVLPEGGITKRSGTRFVKESLADSTFIPFVFSDADGFACEHAATTMRLFRDYGIVESSPGTPFTFVTPFSASEAAALSYDQVGDVQMLAGGLRPIQRLTRLATTSWTIGDLPVAGGPFLTQNADKTLFLYTLTTGDIEAGDSFTLKASANLFSASQVGALFLIREVDGQAVGMWEPSVDFDVGDYVRWDVNTYECLAKVAAAGGTSPPVHLQGAEWDGPGAGTGSPHRGRLWNYLHSGYGVVKITAFTNAKAVAVTAQTFIPGQITATETAGVYDAGSGGTWKWSEGAWSAKNGYPNVVAIHSQRLCAASTTLEPNTLDASVTDDFPNFSAQVAGVGIPDTAAFRYRMEGNKKVNPIRELIPSKALAILTGGDEFVLEPSAVREPLAPDNVVISPATSKGAARARGLKIDTPIFVSRSGRRLHSLTYDFQKDRYVANNLNRMSGHFGISAFRKIAWQAEPYSIIWGIRADGLLWGCSYDPDEGLLAWHRHRMPNARVKDLCVVPNPDGVRQDLWLIVERDLAAGTKRYIECLMPFFEDALDAPAADGVNGWFVDCAVQYNGAAVSTVSGLDHLEGDTVRVLADGKVHPDCVVAGGAITLNYAAAKVTAGLPYNMRLRTLRLDKEPGAVTAAGRKVRVPRVVVELLNAAGVTVKSGGAVGDGRGQTVIPSAGGVTNAPVPLKTAVYDVTIDADWDAYGQLELNSDAPLPCTVLAITPIAQVAV